MSRHKQNNQISSEGIAFYILWMVNSRPTVLLHHCANLYLTRFRIVKYHHFKIKRNQIVLNHRQTGANYNLQISTINVD